MLYGLVFAMYFVLNFGISLLVRAYQRRMVAARDVAKGQPLCHIEKVRDERSGE